MSVSVLILTLNEEINIEKCIKSLAFTDDIVVLDSYSTDSTVDLAKKCGARIYQRKFDNWSSHQNWAVENILFKYQWVYYSDADEIVTNDLRKEMLRVVNDDSLSEVAYRIRFKDMFFGRWIKRSSLYPTWVLRLFKPDKVRWERAVNPTPIVAGIEGKLTSHFEHYSFSKGLTEWFDKQNIRSSIEAKELIAIENRPVPWKHLLSKDPSKKRKALKELSFHIPFRSFLIFIYIYFIRLGFLEGFRGLNYCIIRTMYEYMIEIKAKEIRETRNHQN